MNRTREQLMEAVKAQMPERRWQHTLGVMETAVKLAKQYGADPAKADMAAILHDVCKFWPVEKQAETVRLNPELPQDMLDYDKELWHAPAAVAVARDEYGVTDPEVLDAILYHTSGRERMTQLDKIVCLADYIEPGRDFPNVHKIREIAEYSVEKALVAGFDSTISFLLQQGKRIYPLTVLARNGLLIEIKSTGG
ncbi:phosphohydrolase [Gordoniibacillus kamchatkensis]|uniref:bis(5'-nucleosyl)-tetraphosphatase (symmetrical) n=1 Tax=Gordoniibacillus kamchatkensis TaxID=1590651 RepID=A0ABR5ABQ7_9BACL|nr:bis(5'-nucleosyl)-tetraphosphatase (symmetrical) YqeK [Paenibacillus sp. VKM B-2647]KIL38273.1 phosphohydrolase [Paenibacillus sp. VKM B-2647]